VLVEGVRNVDVGVIVRFEVSHLVSLVLRRQSA
jgi:hypothetical protein